jgi:hypothetical protein
VPAALAGELWRSEEALDDQREPLRLNPSDNQALRYRQAHCPRLVANTDRLEHDLHPARLDDLSCPPAAGGAHTSW